MPSRKADSPKTTPKNRAVVAAAGSGKTTLIASEAVRDVEVRSLVLTFTNQNQALLGQCIALANNGLPVKNVTVMGWFSFLLNECIRPYQRSILGKPDRIRGLNFLGHRAPFAMKSKASFFIDSNNDVYRDSAADLVCALDGVTKGAVIGRLQELCDRIYVDEVQDLHGYDLDVLDLLFASKIEVVLVGDPRQSIIETNIGMRNKKYAGAGIIDWILERKETCSVQSLSRSHRCTQRICDFADGLFPHFERTESGQTIVTGHDGVFEVKRADVPAYFAKYSPVVLRHDKRTDTSGLDATNIGMAKGQTFDRVLLFPSKTVVTYLRSRDVDKFNGRERLYVAVTRARHSVGIVVD